MDYQNMAHKKMEYQDSAIDLIGNTPLVRFCGPGGEQGLPLLAKLEYMNPGGSIKDRLAKYVIEKGISDGTLKKGDTIVDNTSGNTGIGVAMVASAHGIKTVFTSSDKVSQEKIDLLRALGAEVIITPSDAAWDDPQSCYQLAKRMAEEKGYFYFNQYDNPDNILAYYHSLGPELWQQTEGRITHLIAGIGTGGTLSGTARFLKEKNSEIRIIAVDPVGSMFAEYIRTGQVGDSSAYLVEGIGSDMVTKALDPKIIDEVVTVSDKDSFETTRYLAGKHGFMAGGSSGTAAFAAFQMQDRFEKDDVVVVIFADSAFRYLSKCFSDEWMAQHGFSTKSEDWSQ